VQEVPWAPPWRPRGRARRWKPPVLASLSLSVNSSQWLLSGRRSGGHGRGFSLCVDASGYGAPSLVLLAEAGNQAGALHGH
jgi:hypothetical protein